MSYQEKIVYGSINSRKCKERGWAINEIKCKDRRWGSVVDIIEIDWSINDTVLGS